MKNRWPAVVIIALALLWLGHAAPTSADTVDQVTVDTSAANAGGTGQAELIFSLIDGNGTGDGNNTVTLTDISFGAAASLDPLPLGSPSNAIGTLGSTVSMTDTTYDSTFGILFNAGGTVSFLLDLTTNPDSGGTPDAFSFVMFDSNGNLIGTADPTGAETLVDINLDGSSASTFGFASVTSAAVGTPEPSSSLLLLLGLAMLIGLGIARRNRVHSAGPRLLDNPA